MKVLVTGAAGYLGSVMIAELLHHRHSVIALDDLSCGEPSLIGYTRHPGFGFLHGDVRDEATMTIALQEADAVIPLAAVVGMPACDRDPQRAREINVDAIRLLMGLRSKHQRVIFPNTNSGYGSRPGVCTEETQLEPLSLYAKLKAEAELIVLDAENTVSLRLATVFGVSLRMRLDLLVNAFVWKLMRDRRLEVYEGSALRNYIHVIDVAAAFRTIAGEVAWRGGGHRVFNLGNDDLNLSKWDLACTISKHLLGTEVLHVEGIDPDRRNYVVSSERIRKAGFTPQVGLDDGIRDLIAAYHCLPGFYR